MLSQIGQVGFQVRDLEKMETFYKNTLGMKFLFNVPGKLSFFDLDGIRLMMGIREPNESERDNSILYFKVQGIEAAFDELESRGVEIIHRPHLVAAMPDHDLWMGFITDPEGNHLSLMEEKKR